MSQVVTELVIDASGAVSGGAVYERAMESAQAAVDAITKTIRASAVIADQYLTVFNRAEQVTRGMTDQVIQLQRAANEAAGGWHMSGLEMASMTNHLKQAAAAAYALSPAFRELVNPVIATGFRAIGHAAAALGPTIAGMLGTALRGVAPLISTFGRLLLPIVIVKDTFHAMAAIAELGAEKLKAFRDISEGAFAAGVSGDFFQRQSKGAEDFGVKADQATEAVKRFRSAAELALGGSAFDKHLDALIKAGNFADNAGISAYRRAATVEEKYLAIGETITVALEKGERLAGLDLSSKFMSAEMLDRLRANSDLLREMQRASIEIKPLALVSEADLGYAAALNRRLDESREKMANGLKPIHQDLVQLGLNYQDSWVRWNERFANVLTSWGAFYQDVKGVADLLNTMGNAPFWSRFNNWMHGRGLASPPAGLVMAGDPAFATDTSPGSMARNRLGDLLSDPTAVARAMREASEAVAKVRGDLSRPIDNSGPAAAARDIRDALVRATDSVEKYIAATHEQARTVDASVYEQTKAKTLVDLTSAAQRAGIQDVRAYSKEWDILGSRAAEAAERLARAQLKSQTDFGRNTGLLSSEDVQIAQALRGIYPDVAQALNSVEAAGMRTNNILKTMNGSIENNLVNGLSDIASGAKSLKSGFSDMTNSILHDIEKMIIKMLIVGPLMQELQALLGAFGGPGNALPSIALPGGGYSGPIGPVAGLSAPVSSVATTMPVVSVMRSSIRAGNDNAPRVQVNIVNNSGEKVERRQSSQGGVDIHDIVIGEFKRAAAGGEVDDVMGRFSVSPGTRRR